MSALTAISFRGRRRTALARVALGLALAAAVSLSHGAPARAESCPNAGVRAEQGVAEGSAHGLPACRAYELASPVLKNEQEVNVPDRFVAEVSFQAAVEGGGIVYALTGAIPGISRVASTATPSRPARPPAAPGAPPRWNRATASAACTAPVRTPAKSSRPRRRWAAGPRAPAWPLPPSPKKTNRSCRRGRTANCSSPEEEIDNLYLWRSPDEYTLISNVRPENPNKSPEGPTYHVDGISDDCSTVLFEDNNGGYSLPLGPKGEAAPQTSMYEWKVGSSPQACRENQATCRPVVASVLPDGTLATEVVDSHAGEFFSDLHELSSDGKRVFFTAVSDGKGPGKKRTPTRARSTCAKADTRRPCRSRPTPRSATRAPSSRPPPRTADGSSSSPTTASPAPMAPATAC